MTDDRDNADPTLLAGIVGRSRTRAELEAEFGRVWSPDELDAAFVVTAVIPPTVVVRRRIDGVVGTVLMQQHPPCYFRFLPSPSAE